MSLSDPAEPTRNAPSDSAQASTDIRAQSGKRGTSALETRYTDIQQIGRGGMGVVYRARDRETGDVVALKELISEIAGDPDLIERFKRELVLARKITHPNVCRMHEFLRLGDAAVISMEYVEGETLRRFIKRCGPVSVRRGLQWAHQMCSGLDAAHRQGVIHRDLKPDNIMISPEGAAKVMDFGIARSVDTSMTQTGAVIGTPAYMSPEQAKGRLADARSDVYALGLILFEMFTGKAAFEADSAIALLHKHANEAPPRPSSVEPFVPAHISDAILKCLEKDPRKRFQTMEELDKALSGEPGPQRSPASAPSPRGWLWPAVTGILLILAVVGSFLFLRPQAPAGMRHEREVTAIAFSPDGRLLVSGGEDKTVRLWEVATEEAVRHWSGHSRAVTSVAFSPGGKWIASGGWDSTVRLWDSAGAGPERVLKGHTRPVESVAISPDGNWIASGSDDASVKIWDAASGQERRACTGHTGAIYSVAFSPDSSLVASGSDDETVRLWGAQSGEMLRQLKGHEAAVNSVAFSKDGRWLVSASSDSTARIWDVASGQSVRTIHVADNWQVNSVAFSPDGSMIATGSQDGIVRVFEVAGGKERARFSGHEDVVSAVAFSPDGKRLASGSWDFTIRLWPLTAGNQ